MSLNGGNVLTAQERRTSKEDYNIGGGIDVHRPPLEAHIREVEATKIRANMKVRNIISEEILQAAHSLQEAVTHRTSKELDETTVINRKSVLNQDQLFFKKTSGTLPSSFVVAEQHILIFW
ncbi:hypothetical protein [Legionella waltersii]|uniref:Uncharacterized protein n=1 Tax=Legionella waltersii TaxID=66969 RepID=A0A0W1A3W9_9GAMM|nr:hypothetical protein [Legionella waltersii]KTD75699.1 hypothetical protein Lwal_2637 [Legionella waltersii]SNU99498.1 Uncharacterised protein [Legionella waltersii]